MREGEQVVGHESDVKAGDDWGSGIRHREPEGTNSNGFSFLISTSTESRSASRLHVLECFFTDALSLRSE